MGGNTASTSDLSSYSYGGTAIKNNTLVNGTLTVTGEQIFDDAIYTFGSGLTLNQTSGRWSVTGNRQVHVVNGGVVNLQTANTTHYFGRRYKSSKWYSYGSPTRLVLDNGTFSCASKLSFSSIANGNTSGKDVDLGLLMTNGSVLTLPTDKELSFGQVERADSKSHKTVKVTAAVTNSTITAKQVRVGQKDSYISDTGNSFNNITFGPGTVLNVGQVYSYLYPAPTVVFDGAKINWLADTGDSLIGQNDGVTTSIYTIGPNGLVINKDSGYTRTSVSSYASPLAGTGGITKTGAGDITWNNGRIGSSTSEPMTFTGPLVVSNGTWTSTLGYAASAFKANGGTLVLSGALSAASVALAATEGGTLTLAGATIADASPDMTLAGGGTTDYFTRDNAVGTYTLDSLTLGPGAVLDLDANATGIDAIEATTTNITATTENKATINLNFTALPSPGQTFALLETDSADKFTVVPKMSGLTLPSEVSIVDGKLTLAITSDDYTWNGKQTNWGDAGAWTLNSAVADWSDGNNAIFSTANAEAVVAAASSPAKVSFTANGTVSGTATLTVPSVSVASGVTGTINATTAGTLEKTGAGTLMLGASRTDQTTLSEGTLAMADGATVDPAKLTLGSDTSTPVTFDYGGQTLTANPTTYLGAGMDVTLTNGTFTYTASVGLNDGNTPATLTIAKDAVFTTSNRYVINTASEKTINIAGGEFDPAGPDNSSIGVWIMQNSSGLLRIKATDGAVIKMNGHLIAGTGHDASGLSPKIEWSMADSSLFIDGQGLFLGNRSGWSMSNYPVTPQVTLAMTNSVFSTAKGFILGQKPTENTSQTAGWYIAEFDHCIVTSKLCRVYGDRPLSRIHFNGTTLVSNGAGSEWIDAVGFADGMTPVTVGADGLTLDNNGNAMTVAANLGGTGALTFTGSGATMLAAGVAIAPSATVASGTTLTLTGSAQTTTGALTLEAGSTLNIASYTAGVTPLAVTTLTAPADGTATLTYAGGAFSTGTYKILEKSGITAADVGNLVPSTGGETYSYSVSGNTLVLTVGSTVHGRWRASAVGGDFSNPDNWEDGVVPVAGDTLDFSGVTSSCTINFGDLSGTQFAGVDLGTTARQITINGTLRVASMTVTAQDANFSVAAGSKLVVDGDVTLQAATSGSIIYIVYLNNGEVEVGGVVKSEGATKAYPCYNCSETATISVNGLESNYVSGGDNFKLNANKKDAPTVNWIVGAAGLGGTANYWIDRGDGNNKRGNGAVLTAAESFAITRNIGARQLITLDTGDGKTITVTGEIYQTPAGDTTNPLTVKGTGKVICNYAQTHSSDNFNGAVTVADTATLAINPEKCVSTDAIEVASGATLEVAQSGTVTPAGDLSLADGATLKFTFTERRNPPVLNLTGKTVTLGDQKEIKVTLSGERPAYGSDGRYFLTEGGGFSDEEIQIAAAEQPKWVKAIGLYEGNIYAEVYPAGPMILFR